jgi:hypothetical protein
MVFKPGKSGNPSGKPKGARNKTTLAMEKLLDDDAATITSKAIELAKNGDLTALRLCLERIGGDLTPSEAAELSKTIDSFVRVAETADLTERIKRLEQMTDIR